jgi:hypothetical protein
MRQSSIRPATPRDVTALRGLMAEAGLQPNSEPAHLDWKYWRERSDWPGPRSYVLTRGEELLAHAAVIPGACRWGDRRVKTLHLIDWVARPTATGAGVRLMKYLGQTTDALLAIGGSAQTLALLPHLGFRQVGAATCYVRPLHPLRILTPSLNPTTMLLPRLMRGMLWKARAPSGGVDGWHTRPIGSSELGYVTAVLPEPLRGMSVLERNVDLFRYALACPIASMDLYAVEKEGRLYGYFLLSFALRQARLADCWMDSEEPADWHALIQCAVSKAAEHPVAAELAAWASDANFSQRLRECGFHARGDLPVQMLAPRYPDIAAMTLRVQMLDNDAAYRHLGRNEFWS